MNYIEVKIGIKPFTEEHAEIIEAMLCDLPFESFMSEEPYLYCYIKQEEYDERKVKVILSFFNNNPDLKIDISHRLIMEQNWNKEWEKNFTPILMGNLVAIKAPFHKDVPKAKYNIKIEPRMAFGTGHHSTTLLMISAICMFAGEDETQLPIGLKKSFYNGFNLPYTDAHTGKQINSIRNSSVTDMGTGTGILAFLCAKLKAKRPVIAIDIDLNAVNSALTNAWLNRLNNALEVMCGDSSLIEGRIFDYIFANINRNILLEDLPVYSSVLRDGGIVTLSGFYTQDIDTLVKAAKPLNLEMICKMELDGWAVIMLKKN